MKAMFRKIKRLLFGERNGLVKKVYKIDGTSYVTEFKDENGVWRKLETPAEMHRFELNDA